VPTRRSTHFSLIVPVRKSVDWPRWTTWNVFAAGSPERAFAFGSMRIGGSVRKYFAGSRSSGAKMRCSRTVTGLSRMVAMKDKSRAWFIA
jgi:hypothetical protein